MIDIVWLQQQFPEINSPSPMGRGGQKLVFSGIHQTEGEVVLKLFHLNVEEERIMREVMAAQTVGSPRVPRVYGVGKATSQIGDIAWLREERIRGKSLRDVLQVTPVLGPPAILVLALHILEALAAAETVHIVHRDVKPDNIIAVDDGTYALIDFGIARHLEMESLTATGLPGGVGTAGYAPPEQFQNKKREIDCRADLFALGVTLFECVEGYNFYRRGARDVGEILRRVSSLPLPPITHPIDTNGNFRDLVSAMTRIQRNHRPNTAHEALTWIREICDSNGI